MGSDEDRDQRDEQGVEALRADPEERARGSDPLEPEEQQGRIPRSRIGRSARLGTALGSQATRYSGPAAANFTRSKQQVQVHLEPWQIHIALMIANAVAEIKAEAMKTEQMTSFLDADFLPPDYSEINQRRLSKLRTSAPAMPWERVREVLE